jgi:hypothetical protein
MTVILFNVLMTLMFSLFVIALPSPRTKPWRIRQEYAISFLGYCVAFFGVLTGLSFIWIGL